MIRSIQRTYNLDLYLPNIMVILPAICLYSYKRLKLKLGSSDNLLIYMVCLMEFEPVDLGIKSSCA